MIIAGQRPAEIATRFLRSVRGSQCTSSQAAPVVQAAEGEEVDVAAVAAASEGRPADVPPPETGDSG